MQKMQNSDVPVYSRFGGPSKETGHRGMATEKQQFLVILSTGHDNQYPEYVSAKPVAVDNSANVNEMFESYVKMSHDRVLNTDGKTTYNILKDRITVVNQKVDYTDKHHRVKWLNTIIGNIQTRDHWYLSWSSCKCSSIICQ